LKKKISVIIPAYRAEKFIYKNLTKFKKKFNAVLPSLNFSYEIICVIDGTALDKTFQQARKVKGVKAVGYKENRGKGYALRFGCRQADGDVIAFFDVDGDFDPEQITTLIPYLDTADIVIGSKRHPFSRLRYPFLRRILSKGFQLLSTLILGINLRDTQSGIKIFKRRPLGLILPLSIINRFAFDLELCFLAQKHGFRVIEAPIAINFKGRSTIATRAISEMFKDLLKIRYTYSCSRRYQKKFFELNFKS